MSGQVLVVDDSPTLRRVVAAMLQQHGYEPLLANDAEHALSLLQEQPLVGAVLDEVLPRQQGHELGQSLRQDPRYHALPLVMMSAALEELPRLAQQLRAAALPKPFDREALRRALLEATRRVTEPSDARPQTIKPTPTSRSLTEAASEAVIAVAPPASLPPEQLSELAAAMLQHLGAGSWFRRHELEEAAIAVLGQPVVPAAPESIPSSRGQAREVLRGLADAVPLGEVLQVLQMQQQTGVLEVRRGTGPEVRIFFRNGYVDLVMAQGTSPEFRMGRYLLEDDIVPRPSLDEAVTASQRSGKLLGDELIERGLAQREQIQAALMRQSSELIYEVLRWTGAQYRFVRNASPPAGLEADLGLPVASLVMEGFRRVDEWRMIEEQLDPQAVLMRDEVALDRLGSKRLGRLEQQVLEAIDGQRTAQQIIEATSTSSFEGSKILYQFLQSRLVRRRAS